MKNKIEISWSLFHPTRLDTKYMRRVIDKAAYYNVDSFEICGSCHSNLGGLDGLLLFEDYPSMKQLIERPSVLENRRQMRKIIKLAHASGYPCFYWHREVTVCDGLLDDIPELMDGDGEFDLLGDAYEYLMRYKIINALKAVPELDGVVLTLTESDFSVIHNSNQKKYPPIKVVEKIVRIFNETLNELDKRFILRSFGSIKQDYEDILAGAALAAIGREFEIETKSTAYDFIPFLPLNPFLKSVPGTVMGIECDSVGEFLGAGYLPAENVDKAVEYVRGGLSRGVGRFAIRIDRVGNNIFDTHEINLFAFHQAINSPDTTAEIIRRKWWKRTCPDCATEMQELAVQSGKMVRQLHFIDGSVIFHMFPIEGDFKWIKAGGILSVFKNGVDLRNLSDAWGIRAERVTPGRDKIIAEKERAVNLAVDGLEKLYKLKDKLSKKQFSQAESLWKNACIASKAVLCFVKCVCAYFDDMEQGLCEGAKLNEEISAAETELTALLSGEKRYEAKNDGDFSNGMDRHIYCHSDSNLDNIYVGPLLELCRQLKLEYAAEYLVRKELSDQFEAVDMVVCGGFTDDWRIRRYMHGSHAVLHKGRAARFAGNRVFPNGFIEIDLHVPENTDIEIIIYGAPDVTDELGVVLSDVRKHCRLDKCGYCRLRANVTGPLVLRLEKSGSKYPLIYAVAAKVLS